MEDEVLEVELLLVTMFPSIAVLDEDESLREFLFTLLLTISLATD